MELNYTLNVIHPEQDVALFHPHVELIFVMKGIVKVYLGEKEIEVLQNEFFLINFGEKRRLAGTQDAVAALLEFDYVPFLEICGRTHVTFACDTGHDKTKSHYNLNRHFRTLLHAHLIGDRILEEKSAFYALLNTLFLEYASSEHINSSRTSFGMEEVLLYLHIHFREHISLQEICEKFHYSVSTFTRNFRKMTGENLIQYINDLRVYQATELLDKTDNSITWIALECGFSELAVFNKTFRKYHDCTPGQYRKEMRRKREEEKENQLIIDVQNSFARDHDFENSGSENKIIHHISAEMSSGEKFSPVFSSAVGVRSVSDLLSSKYQQQILRLKEKLKITYVHLPNLFSDSMYSALDRKFSFEWLDGILDFFVENGLEPFIELSDRSRVIIREDGRIEEDWESQKLFRNIMDYEETIRQLMYHLNIRYGPQRCKEWIWEIGFNNRRWSEEDYLQQFSICRNQIRSWLPDARIGGCGIHLGERFPDFMKNWINSEEGPDFLSFCAYPYKDTGEQVEKISRLVRSDDPHFFERELWELHARLNEMTEKNIPILFSAFNITKFDRNYVNDSNGKAAFLLHAMVHMSDQIQMGVYDVASDLSCHDVNSQLPFFGGRGLVSRDGIDKPVLQVLRALSYQGKHLIQKGDHFLITSNGSNMVNLLCYNWKSFNFNYYGKLESEIKIEELDYIYENNDRLVFQFTIKGLRDGMYKIGKGILNSKTDALHQWISMGGQDALDIGDHAYLQQRAQPQVKLERCKVEGGRLDLTVEMEENEIIMMNIYPLSLK